MLVCKIEQSFLSLLCHFLCTEDPLQRDVVDFFLKAEKQKLEGKYLKRQIEPDNLISLSCLEGGT